MKLSLVTLFGLAGYMVWASTFAETTALLFSSLG